MHPNLEAAEGAKKSEEFPIHAKYASRQRAKPDEDLKNTRSYISNETLKIKTDTVKDASLLHEVKKFDSPKIQSRVDLDPQKMLKKNVIDQRIERSKLQIKSGIGKYSGGYT